MNQIDYSQLQRVIAVANGKGGVFKSSVTANIGGLAAAAGHSVLIVDMDPQGDISDDLGYFDDDRDDAGEGLAASLAGGTQLQVPLMGVRQNLDVIPAGPALEDVAGVLLARSRRGASTTDLLARALAPIAGRYDLVLIDTPPGDERLQSLVLSAARWVIAPTKADKSSIRHLETVAVRMAESRSIEHHIDLLAVVLAGVPTSASRVRGSAQGDITEKLGSFREALVPHVIRASDAVAKENRDRGVLAHELAQEVEGAEPYWKALRSGRQPQRLPGTAPALADDYVHVTHHVLRRLNDLESAAIEETA